MSSDYSYMQANIRYVNIWYLNTACNGLTTICKPTQLEFWTDLVLTLLGELGLLS